MTTNKQSEKRKSSIMVIEDKTLKTLTKKENKQMNHSINKTIKSITTHKSIPQYELKKDSYLDLKLPNGMKLNIVALESGYCYMDISNHSKENDFKIITEEENREFDTFTTKTAKIKYRGSKRGLGISFTKYNNK
jgi:hypothetical protein